MDNAATGSTLKANNLEVRRGVKLSIYYDVYFEGVKHTMPSEVRAYD